MDDATRLALIRAVLATFEANSEADDGDRNLASPGACIEAIASIADETNAAPGYGPMCDGWLNPDAVAVIITAQPGHPANPANADGR
jgi:hypothetical protein